MSVCQTNPLNTLVSKSGQRFSHAGPTSQVGSQTPRTNGGSVLDRQFAQFTGAEHSLQPLAPVPLSQQHRQQHVQHVQQQSQNQNQWIEQFAGMQVRDGTEFSDEYKRMYSQYETRGTPAHALRAGAPSMRMLAPQMHMQLPMSSAQLMSGEVHLDQTQLDKQFAEMESELEAAQEAADSVEAAEQLQSTHFDEDQLRLKEAAESIYSTLSTKSSTSTNSKFSNSKFMGLMRNIGEGVVTIKKDSAQDKYTELYSPHTGETFGEEYFPVQEHVLTDPLQNQEDFSNMSSSEAAARVLQSGHIA